MRLWEVKCGACGMACRRPKFGREVGTDDTPLVFTRTLVAGQFLPSCSEVCAGVLRAKIGDRPAPKSKTPRYAI